MEKVAGIARMELPNDVKWVRCFLRKKLNCYRRFVPDIPEQLVPLNNLLEKGRNMEITPIMEDNARKYLK